MLAPASRPLRVTNAKRVFMGGDGKVQLTASLHRLYWVAGQRCFVNVSVVNKTKKAMNSLTLSLIRSIIIFKPTPVLDPLTSGEEIDMDSCQTSTTQKELAESTLTMGHHGTRGHASAKGWWTGVGPGARSNFAHQIHLPASILVLFLCKCK